MDNSSTLDTTTYSDNSLSLKLKGYITMFKLRLSLTVAFSGIFGYLMGTNWSLIDPLHVFLFLLGSLLIVFSSNILNQIYEKNSDALMGRTASRPLPQGIITVKEAYFSSLILAVAGFILLAFFTNLLAASLSILSLILYAFVYTPLKPVTSFSVLAGAFPGALPPLIGWSAVTGSISQEALILFGIQFIWQFPHFWAIAWVCDDDYSKAKFKMLPSNSGKNAFSALQISIYSFLLIPISLLPAIFEMVSDTYVWFAIFLSTAFALATVPLLLDRRKKYALIIMFASFFYLPLLQTSLLIFKL